MRNWIIGPSLSNEGVKQEELIFIPVDNIAVIEQVPGGLRYYLRTGGWYQVWYDGNLTDPEFLKTLMEK